MKRLYPLLLSLMMVACPSLAQDKPLQLDVKMQSRLQIRVAALQTAHSSGAIPAFATVIDPTPLVTVLSDLTIAQSGYAASRAEADRTQILAKDASVSTKVAEAAQAQARADQAKVVLLRQRLGLEWGGWALALSDTALSQMGNDLAMGQAALVRIDTPGGTGLKGARSASLDLNALGTVQARVLGVARTADTRLQSPGLITWVTGANAAYLNHGLTLKASLYNGANTFGILIPNSALLRQGGHVYAWIKTGAQTFVRRIVTPVRVVPDGVIVGENFAAGDQVVVQGASALLTAATSAPSADD